MWSLYEKEEVEIYLNRNEIPQSWPRSLKFIKENIKSNKSFQCQINVCLKMLVKEAEITQAELLEINQGIE